MTLNDNLLKKYNDYLDDIKNRVLELKLLLMISEEVLEELKENNQNYIIVANNITNYILILQDYETMIQELEHIICLLEHNKKEIEE